jgi:hypothetical protein
MASRTIKPIASRVSSVALPICGVRKIWQVEISRMHERLICIHIQTGRKKPARPQGFNQGLVVHNVATGELTTIGLSGKILIRCR